MRCPRCQHENRPQATFCEDCGTPFKGASPTTQSFADLKAEVESLRQALTESLQQQMATADILRAISRSPTDLQPVLDSVAENATRLCDAYDAAIFRVAGNVLRLAAHHGPLPAPADLVVPLIRSTAGGRAVIDRRTFQVADLQVEVEDFPEGSVFARQLGHRTVLNVPLVRGGVAIGVIQIRRAEVRPFTDAQIELVKTFADQAVIAIENVRLFQELEARNRDLTEALEQQTATSEILRVISSSPTDIQPVLNAVADSAARLCQAADAQIFRADGDFLRLVASFGSIPLSHTGRPINRGWVTGRSVVDRRTVHVHDLAAESESEYPEGRLRQRLEGHRTTLATPLLREGQPLGTILIRRMEVRPFSDKQIKLLETFADQAVIAIENVRLFQELQEKNRALT
jgi:GAF domain-containing protein